MNETHTTATIDVEMDGPIWLKIRMKTPAQSPEDLLRWFTDPARLVQWMGDEHDIDLVSGGRYAIHYTRARRTMEGEVIVARPTELVFSWAFTHEPETPARVVMVRTVTSGDATHGEIILIHGPYRDDMRHATASTEDEDRAGHLEGWRYFLPILHARLSETALTA
ncbi:MAG: SRPBCC domain-containing protein [Thermomicrobiales bacterium]